MIKISLGDENKCFLDLNKLDRKLLIITPSSDSAFYEVEKLIYMPRNKNSIEVEFENLKENDVGSTNLGEF